MIKSRQQTVDSKQGTGLPSTACCLLSTVYCLLSTIAALLLCAQSALAQGKAALKVGVAPVALRCRSNSPMALDVTFTWEGTRLLEGRLEIVLRDGNEVVGKYLSAELVLTTGEQSTRLLLPPVSASSSDTPLQVQMRFLTKDGSAIELGDNVLFCPTPRERSLVICVSRPHTGMESFFSQDDLSAGSGETAQDGETESGPPAGTQTKTPGSARLLKILRSMRLEQLHPDGANMPRKALSTFWSYTPPEDLPAFPIGYCPFDMVFLAGEGFSLLRHSQLKVLSRWVEAGGSVCIMPPRTLKPYHVDFLNNLSRRDYETDSFFLNTEGELGIDPILAGRKVVLCHAGLGRAAVMLEALKLEGGDLDSADWRETVAFLWKVRAFHNIVRYGKWSRRDEYSRGYVRRRTRTLYSELEFHVMPVSVCGELLDTLIPKTSRVIPFWVIILILILFVAVIGPLDYFVLGLLKKRYLTWVLFPAVSIGFTLFTVYLSELYMGRADHENSVLFVDVGEGGQVLRWSRFSVIFAGSHTERVNEVKGGLFSPLDHTQFGARRSYYGYDRPRRGDKGGPPWYVGRIPGHFSVTQKIRQWTPQLNRRFSLGPVEGVPKLNWDAVDSSILSSRKDRWHIQAQLFGKVGTEAQVCLFNKSDYHVVSGPPYLSWEVLKLCSVRPREGLFHVVSQVSPTGADNFEDIAVLDSTDPRQWLLIVVTRAGNDFIVQRRLYHGVR